MAKPARKKSASKPKFKRKTLDQHKENKEKETGFVLKSEPVAEPVIETPSVPAEAETISSGGLTNTPLPSNNITMEIKEEPVPEITLPKEEVVEQPESVPELTLNTEVPAEEKADRLSFLTEKPSDKEKVGGEEKPKKPFLTIILVLTAFLLGMLVGGCIVYKKGNIFAGKIFEKKETAAENQEQTSPSPAPTEEPVDLTQYTIQVLNGSETKGAAGKLKEALAEEGFTVSSAGNATNSAFIKTVIRAQKEVDKPYLKKLQDFLSKSYSLAEIQDLESSVKTDVVVIIGEE